MGKIARSLQLHGGLPGRMAVSLESALAESFNIVVDDTPDPASGVDSATVGFQVTDFLNEPSKAIHKLQFAVFEDQDLSVPSLNATLATAAEGTILDGEASAALELKTDANGRFSCKITDPAHETVWVGSASLFGSRSFDNTGRDDITFIP